MKILITGNMGYVGSVLSRYLRREYPSAELIGFDSGYFAHSLTGADCLPERYLSRQYFGDIRDIDLSLLSGVDAVVHLAAVSNDPMGNEFEAITAEINRASSVKLALLASRADVKNFVFASSCSMYGVADGGPRKESDPTNPLTAYARSKIGTETDLRGVDLGSMVLTSLRFATACGWSPRLRLDLVLNDFVASAVTVGEISVLSDGSPWRPLIDVEDMCRAISWALSRLESNGGAFLAINAGSDFNNYQVRYLAETVAGLVPNVTISINKNAPPDKRSYAVDFTLYRDLAPKHQPQVSLEQSINRLRNGFTSMNFSDKNFRQASFMRLNTLRSHIAEGNLERDLRWKN